MERLKRRRDFLAAAKGRRTPRRAFVLESRDRADDGPPRFGFTITKRTAAKAVERNRIRRRLKEAARRLEPGLRRPGLDLVLVGRRPALTMSFGEIAAELAGALSLASAPTGRSERPDARSSD